MIAQIAITDNDLKAFFGHCGVITEMVSVPEFVNESHNRSREYSRDVLHIVHGEKKLPAKQVFELAMKIRLIQPDQRTIEIVKRELNK